jgi:hypothetical protein
VVTLTRWRRRWREVAAVLRRGTAWSASTGLAMAAMMAMSPTTTTTTTRAGRAERVDDAEEARPAAKDGVLRLDADEVPAGGELELPVGKGAVVVGPLRVPLGGLAAVAGDPEAPREDVAKNAIAVVEGEGVAVAESVGDLEEGRAAEAEHEAVVGEGGVVPEEEGLPVGGGHAETDALEGGARRDPVAAATPATAAGAMVMAGVFAGLQACRCQGHEWEEEEEKQEWEWEWEHHLSLRPTMAFRRPTIFAFKGGEP